jgi:hypothetical protein
MFHSILTNLFLLLMWNKSWWLVRWPEITPQLETICGAYYNKVNVLVRFLFYTHLLLSHVFTWHHLLDIHWKALGSWASTVATCPERLPSLLHLVAQTISLSPNHLSNFLRCHQSLYNVPWLSSMVVWTCAVPGTGIPAGGATQTPTLSLFGFVLHVS